MNHRIKTTRTTAISTSPLTGTSAIACLCLILLCGAYLQGGIDKAVDFPGAVAEMTHFGLAPAAPMALLTILGEIGASILVISGVRRWWGALYLGVFTLAATLLANRFWELAGPARTMLENGFFEHLGLAGAFFLVAWSDFHATGKPAF